MEVSVNLEKSVRTFSDDNGNTFHIVSPSASDIRGADWEYSKCYTKSLVAGITTTAEMTDILMRRGIIGPEFDQRAEELTTILSDKIQALSEVKDSADKRILALEVAQAREELFQWNQRLNAPLSNTCEQISDDARLEYLTACIVVDSNGNKVWENFDKYLAEKEQGLSQKARFEVMLYLQGLDSDFLNNTPEAIAMQEANNSVVEEAEAIVKKEEEAKKSKNKATQKKITKKTPSKKEAINKTPSKDK